MPNSRISDLNEKVALYSNGLDQTTDDDALLLLARTKSHNETIKYSNFKNSINDYNVRITGSQFVEGEKTFADNAFFQSDVSVDGDLSVRGDIFNLKFQDGGGANLDQFLTQLDSNLSALGDLTVSGKSFLKDDLTADKDIKGLGKLSVNTSEQREQVTIDGNVSLLDAAKVKTADVDLIFADGTSVKIGNAGGLEVTTTKDAEIGRDLTVTRDTLVKGELRAEGDSYFEENVFIGKNLTVTGDVFNVAFDPTSSFADSYTTNFDSDLTVAGNASFHGTADIHQQFTAKEAATFEKPLLAKETATIEGNLLAKADAVMSQALTVSGAFSAKAGGLVRGGDLDVDTFLAQGVATFKDDVEMQTQLEVTGPLDVGGHLHAKDELTVDGQLNINSDAVILQDLTAKGTTTLEGELHVQQNARFDENVIVGKNLTVTGDIFNVAFDPSSGFSDNYTTNFDSDLTISGKSYLKDDVTAEKDIIALGDISLQDAAKVKTAAVDLILADGTSVKIGNNGGLEITTDKDVLTGRDLTVENDLRVKGSVTLDQDLSVQGFTATEDSIFQKDVIVSGQATVHDQFTAMDLATFEKPLLAEETITAEGDLLAKADAVMSQALTVSGVLSAESTSTLTGAVVAQDNLTVDKVLEVKETSTLTGDVEAKADLTVTGTTITDKLLYSNMYANLVDLPDASTYHGMFAHVHTEERAYFSHAGSWHELLDVNGNQSITANLDVEGNATVKDVLELGTRAGMQGSFQLFQDKPGNDEILTIGYYQDPYCQGGVGANQGLCEGDSGTWITPEKFNFHISETGKIGIGTNAPEELLHILQPVGGPDKGILVETPDTEHARIQLSTENGSNYLLMGHGEHLTSPHYVFGDDLSYIQSGGQDLAIFTTSDDTDLVLGAGSKKMLTVTGTNVEIGGQDRGHDVLFSEDANVGINVTTVGQVPATDNKFKLHVKGDVKIEGEIFAESIFELIPTIPNAESSVGAGDGETLPTGPSAVGPKGKILYDNSFVYLCIEENTWRRFPLQTW